ncbi:MAG: hypothetical protein K1000chlam2_00587 [Chlamydiae bacterium]|nr:hypothetical protein [Chlamydiota bacterium]
MPVIFLILGLAVFFLHRIFQKKPQKETLRLLLFYLVFFSFGVNRVFDFIAQVFFSEKIAAILGFTAGGAFQFQVGVASLALGVLGILCFWLRGGFLFAAVLGNVIFLWGSALGYLLYSDSAGVYFWADALIPLFILYIYWLCVRDRR